MEIKGLGLHLQDAGDNVEIELIAAGCKQLSYSIDVPTTRSRPIATMLVH